jgi:hypothetical protein
MKKLILPSIAGAALVALSACSHTTVEPAAQPAPVTSTTETTPATTTTTTQQTQTPTSTTTTQTTNQ